MGWRAMLKPYELEAGPRTAELGLITSAQGLILADTPRARCCHGHRRRGAAVRGSRHCKGRSAAVWHGRTHPDAGSVYPTSLCARRPGVLSRNQLSNPSRVICADTSLPRPAEVPLRLAAVNRRGAWSQDEIPAELGRHICEPGHPAHKQAMPWLVPPQLSTVTSGQRSWAIGTIVFWQRWCRCAEPVRAEGGQGTRPGG
jgi:hypothetical protein